jgi:PAS domain S-box-containing protein
MVVEDEGIIAQDIKNCLEGLGYNVPDVVFTGREAIQRAEELRPDLVLMDIVLKGDIDGIETASEIRKKYNIPIVYLTAYEDDKTLKRAKLTEPLGYILKPFEERYLRSSIEMALYKHQMETRLKQNERWLSTVLRSVGEAVVVTDENGLVQYTNPTAEQLTGWSLSEIQGKDIEDVFVLIDEITRVPVKNPVKRVLAENRVIGRTNHTILLSREAKEIYIDFSASPMKDDKGRVTGVVFIIQNITDRKKAELAIKESESKFRNLFDHATDAIFVQSLNGRILSVNNQACNLLGYSKEELYNLKFSDLINENITDNTFLIFSALREKGSYVFETQYRTKYGLFVDVEISMQLIKLLDENVVQLFARDITDRKQAQEKINMLASAIKGISEAVSMTDIYDKIIYVNNAFLETYGYQQDELIGKNLSIIRSPNNPPGIYDELVKETMAGGWQGELLNIRKDGTEFPIQLSTSQLKNERGETVAYIGIATDISERKKADEALRLSEKRYQDLYDSAPDMYFSIGRDGMVKSVNNYGAEYLGYEVKELIGTEVWNIVHIEDQPVVKLTITQMFATKKSSSLEFRKIKKDGTIIWVNESTRLIFDEDGRPKELFIICRDITKNKEFQIALQKSEQRYRKLAQNAPVSVARYSLATSEFEYANDEFERQMGCRINEYTKLSRSEKIAIIYSEDRQKVAANYEKWKYDGYKGVLHFDYRIVNKKNLFIWLDTFIYADFDESGNAVTMNELCIDVTERKKADQALLESEKKYRTLAESAPIAVSKFNPETDFYEYVNKEFEKIVGYSLDEFNALSKEERNRLAYKEDIEAARNKHQEWTNRGCKGTQHLEYRIYNRFGSLIWIDTYTYADFNERGKVTAFNQVFLDITERKLAEQKIFENEKKYKNLASNAPISVSRLSAKTFKYEYVNDEFVKQTGYTMEEYNALSKEDLKKLSHPEDSDKVKKFYDDWKINGFKETQHLDYRMFDRNGKLYWLDTFLYADFDEEGNLLAINQICIDITDQKLTQQKILESEAKYKGLASNAPVAVTRLIIDTEMYDFVNDEFVRQSGYNKEEYNKLDSESLVEMIYPEDRDRIFLFYKNWRDENLTGTQRIEYRIINRYKQVLWLDTYMYAEHDENGKPIALNQVCVDITEQRKAQDELREKDEKFRALIENITDLIALVDNNGTIVYASPSTEKILGYKVENYLGQNLFDMIHPEDIAASRNIFNEVLEKEGNIISNTQYRFKDANNSWRWHEASFHNLLNDPSISAVVVNHRDITERKKAEEEIFLQKSYFQHLFESSPEGIVILDNQERIVNVNKGFEKMFQYSAGEIQGKDLNKIIVPGSLLEQATQMTLFVLKGEIINRETVRKRKDGSLVDVSILAYPITIGEDQIGVYGIYSDISERKETEKALRNSEERYKAFVKNSTEGIWRFEFLEPISLSLPVEDQIKLIFKFGYLAECNDVYAKMYGYENANEIVGARITELLPDTDPRNVEYLRKCITNGYKLDNVESYETDKYGSKRVFQNNLVGIVENDYLVRAWGTQKDITESKRAQEELSKTQLRLATLLNNLPDVVLYETGKGKSFISENVIDMLGYPAGKFIDDKFFKTIMHPGDLKDVQKKIIEWHRQGAPGVLNLEFRVRRADGRYIWLEDHMVKLRDNGKKDHMSGVLIDVTDHKQSEEKLKQLAEKLSISNKELEQFAYVASHDLQEPLRMVASYIQLLQRRYKGNLSSEADEFINYAIDGVIRMKSLINDLLVYSRVNTKEFPAEEVDVNKVLKQTITTLKTSIDETGATVLVENMPTVNANETQLGQLFQNLISNAIKFRKSGVKPEVKISAKHAGHEWLFSVSDNGIGINKEFTDKIFIIFQRLHNSQEYPGTGIGLAICKKIIEKLGGHIWVESETDKGSTFSFTIPDGA